MIKFINISPDIPYSIFVDKYNLAVQSSQKNIEAVLISSYDTYKSEVDSRFVNLKFIEKDQFIFFSNYNSPKSTAFRSHSQIAAVFYWDAIKTQIRIKANIAKTSKDYNDTYFKKRSINKNALAISSRQSNPINNFDQVHKRYAHVLNNEDLSTCPSYWGGFSFIPFEIEFWVGHEFRLNKRILYKKNGSKWDHFFLEP